LSVPLKEFYTGKERKLKINKQVICSECEGTGAKAGKTGEVSCIDCKGRGMVMEVNQIRPGFISQTQRACEKCKGNKVVEEPKVVTVNVEKGMDEGEKIMFYGESDQSPGASPGDLIVVLTRKKAEEVDEVWNRQGEDLVYKKTISLVEALTGYQFVLNHLDDRKILVKGGGGDVVKPGDVRLIENEGMPRYKSPFEKGKLYVVFEIEFPTWEEIKGSTKELQKVLPVKKGKGEKGEKGEKIEEVEAKVFKMPEGKKKNKHKGGERGKSKGSDEEEEAEDGRRQENGRGGTCQQQ